MRRWRPREQRMIDYDARYGISKEELSELADYNSRVAKGIVHTPEYAERMAKLQTRFNMKMEYGGASRVLPTESSTTTETQAKEVM